jgi:hypothetical protein
MCLLNFYFTPFSAFANYQVTIFAIILPFPSRTPGDSPPSVTGLGLFGLEVSHLSGIIVMILPGFF